MFVVKRFTYYIRLEAGQFQLAFPLADLGFATQVLFGFADVGFDAFVFESAHHKVAIVNQVIGCLIYDVMHNGFFF